MAQGDDDKTVFGGKLPDPNKPISVPEGESPFSKSGGQAGGAIPPQAPPRPAPGGFSPSGPESGNTWLGGPLNPGDPPPDIGAPADSGKGFFPEMSSATDASPIQDKPRVSLDQALRAAGLGKGASSNPLVAGAANLLILFGRLRTGMVEMDAQPLMDHVTREIDAYERSVVADGADPHEAMVAKYALCGTADDIVQNLPGADRGAWIQYSMVARFFHKRDSGVGFFQEAEKAMQVPGQRYQLLELMLICLSLGFQGQYRTMQNGIADLSHIRRAIYETLRRVTARPDDDISVSWMPVLLGGRRRFSNIPMWATVSVAALLLVAVFAILSTLINQEGSKVANTLFLMHPADEKITLARSAPIEVYIANVSQLERIETALAPEIDEQSVEVGIKGSFIYVRVGELLLFSSGRADVRTEFTALAEQISDTLSKEAGPVRVLGYTDSLQPSGRGRYKTNLALSIARAESVANLLKAQLADASRVTVEGRGAADPIGDNKTRVGRAKNRRVEILIAREGMY